MGWTKALVFGLMAISVSGGLNAQRFSVSSVSLDSKSPQTPGAGDYSDLRQSSPFLRVLDPGETYSLRGVAFLDGREVATLYNRETKKSVVVTPDKPNEDGLQLVRVNLGGELEGVTATISIAGEEVELKYELKGMFPVAKVGGAAGGGKGEVEERRGPSKEDIERYRSLSEEDRNKLRKYMGHVMSNYQDLSREERGNMIRGAVMRLSDGKELKIPQPEGSNSNDISGSAPVRPSPQGR